LASSQDECGDGEEEDGGDNALGPEAVDAPFLEDVSFDVAEEGGEEEADLGEFEDQPPAAHEGEDADDGVACDSEDGDGDVGSGLWVLIEGAGREYGEAAVIDGAAVEFFGDGAGRSESGVHVVNVKSHGGDDNACNRQKSNQILHVLHFTQARLSCRRGYGV
jgi:hypothetical protein